MSLKAAYVHQQHGSLVQHYVDARTSLTDEGWVGGEGTKVMAGLGGRSPDGKDGFHDIT